MPYITPSSRDKFIAVLNEFGALIEYGNVTPGQMNYLITSLLMRWLSESPGYEEMSQARGVLQDVADEFFRRMMIPYEDYKLDANGDVYRNPLSDRKGV